MSLSAEARARHLVAEILSCLYEHYYLQGEPLPTLPVWLRAPSSGDAGFIGTLSDANHGTGRWESGWTVVERDDDGIWVERDGLTVWITPETYQREPGSEPSTGTSVAVRMPKEFPAESPGFYLAQSDEPPELFPDDILVRLYWHVTPAGAIRLIDSVTSRLNAERVPFQIKVLNDPNAYHRNDAGVLYITKRDLARASHLLKQVYDNVRSEVLPREPALTMHIAPGLGLAEDPGNGESFGLHRCRLLAEAFVDAAEQGTTDPIERLRKVEERFEREGLDLSHPYLNAGSADEYAALLDLTSWHLDVDSASSSSIDIRPDIPVGDELELHAQYLKTAEEIGDRLVKDAFWYDERCTWLGKLITQSGMHDPSGIATFGSIGPDVYTGTAGIALFLAQLYAETSNDQYAATARAAINQTIHTINRLLVRGGWGFYTGWPGVVTYTGRIGQLLDDQSLTVVDLTDIVDSSIESGWPTEPDLLSGESGTIIALLTLARTTGNKRFLSDAIRLGDHLLSTAKRRGRAIWWSVQTQSGRRGLTGFAHGSAGIAFALLQLFSATQEERFREAAEATFSFERRNFHPKFQNWLDLRYPVQGSRFGPAAPVSSVWCHGSGGIAISRLTARKILGDQIYLDEAETAVRATRAWVESRLALPEKPWSLCHGLPGNADILLWAAESLPEQSVALKQLAIRVADAGIAALTRENEFEESICADEPGLMLGLAGFGYFYLRLANPEIPSVLIPNTTAFAFQP